MHKDLISVIVPAFNAQSYIERTIQSILKQDITQYDIEIIIVDDGSTDQTVDIVEKYKDQVTLYKQANSGVARARNFAVSKAKGKWLAFLDADDVWKSHKITTQLETIGNYVWSHTDSVYIGHNQDGTTKRSDLTTQYGEQVFEKLLLNNFITTSTLMIRKDIYIEFGGFDESFEALEDWKLWLDIAKQYPLHYVPDVLAEYRILPGSTSRKARHALPLHLQLTESVFAQLTPSKQNAQLKASSLAESYQTCSYIAEDSKDYSYSFYCALMAWRYNVTSLTLIKRVIRALLNTTKAIR